VFIVDVWLQMAAVYMLLLSALVLSCNKIGGRVFGDDPNEETEDFSDWRDPTDMINYDLATGKMRNTEVCFVRLRFFYCVNVISLCCFPHLRSVAICNLWVRS